MLSPVLHADETTFQVLKEKGKPAASQSYLWGIANPFGSENPLVYFEYHPTRAQTAANQILQGFKGFLQTDAYGGYNHLASQPEITGIACMAQIRRRFHIAQAVGASTGTSLAAEAMTLIGQLYDIERRAAKDALLPPEILEIRKDEARPLMEWFETWLKHHIERVPPK